MMRRLIGLACLLVLAATCNRDASPPAPTSPTSPTPQPTLSSVELRGGPLVPPGESHQFTAIATFSDRTTRDVTADATWRVLNSVVFTVAAGLVTATGVGEGTLSVSYQNRGASLSIVGIPSGTGILTGFVREATFPISGATIEVAGGSFAGRSTTSNSSGFYRLYGVVGELQIRVSAGDYVPQTVLVNVAPFATPRRDQVMDFDLSLSRRVVSLAGEYRATLRASATCGTNIPAEAAVRNYLATVHQEGARLTILLSGAEFGTIAPGVLGNRIDGRARPDTVELLMGSRSSYYYRYYYYTWGLVERLNPTVTGPWGVAQGLYLAAFGNATGSATSSTISTVLNGTLALYDAPGGFLQQRKQVSACNARDHQMVLTRQ